MILLEIVMLLVCIVVPLAFAWQVLRVDEPSLGGWLLLVANATVLAALILLVGRWDMAGYYTRFLVLGLFAAAVLWSLGKHRSRSWWSDSRPLRGYLQAIASLAVFGAALAYVISGIVPQAQPVELAFPLKDGRFMVGQGGGVGLLNYHASHAAQRYAADITGINAYGYRAAGLAPKELERYAIFGATVVSPCAGKVIKAENGLPDLVPPQRDRDSPAGNHVVIDCGGFVVELAHMKQGSARVAASDAVAAGDILGQVGNSGNTTEPHLHIHAVDPVSGAGLPVTFCGRAPVRNRLFTN